MVITGVFFRVVCFVKSSLWRSVEQVTVSYSTCRCAAKVTEEGYKCAVSFLNQRIIRRKKSRGTLRFDKVDPKGLEKSVGPQLKD